MKIDYPLPALMKALPMDERGYPIPYFVPIVNGKPEFRYQDSEKRDICLKRKVCSICGKKLYNKSYWFISGPLGLRNRISSDAPMHEDCARYSVNVCPHLVYAKAQCRSDPAFADPNIVRAHPDTIILIKADRYETESYYGKVYIRFRPVFTERYTYQDNRLTLKL